MRLELATFQEASPIGLVFEPSKLLAHWPGPPSLSDEGLREALFGALEAPRNFPALRQAVVPGDAVVIALDDAIPGESAILETVITVLESAGLTRDAITLLRRGSAPLKDVAGDGPSVTIHDPDQRDDMAYLASTEAGQRVYLNRKLVEADFVFPIAFLGHREKEGGPGPWSLLYPGLSDREAQSRGAGVRSIGPESSIEVSWLLGSQLQLGLVRAADGIASVIAGATETVAREGAVAQESAWSFQAPEPADLVISTIGGPDQAVSIEDLATGLESSMRVVSRGGKIVVIARFEGPITPELRRLGDLDRSGRSDGPGRSRGGEDDASIRRIARALAWADVYLLSPIGPDDVDELGMVGITTTREIQRLIDTSTSCLVLEHAEWTNASLIEAARAVDDA